jgi:hypothetical protein
MDSLTTAIPLLLILLWWGTVTLASGIIEGLYRCDLLLENYEMFKYRAANKNIVCTHCESESFTSKQVLQNSMIASLIGFDWANRQATALQCMGCGQITWFAQKPIKTGEA